MRHVGWMLVVGLAGCANAQGAGEVEVVEVMLHHQVVRPTGSGGTVVDVVARPLARLYICSPAATCEEITGEVMEKRGFFCSTFEHGEECPGIAIPETNELHVYWWE